MLDKYKILQIESLDKKFKNLSVIQRPREGWIKVIRTSLLMPMSYIASKMNVSIPAIAKFEKNEVDEVISIKSLRAVAQAMDCELHYVLVPNKGSIGQTIKSRIEKKKRLAQDDIAKTMALEDQMSDQILGGDSPIKVKIDLDESGLSFNSKIWNKDEN